MPKIVSFLWINNYDTFHIEYQIRRWSPEKKTSFVVLTKSETFFYFQSEKKNRYRYIVWYKKEYIIAVLHLFDRDFASRIANHFETEDKVTQNWLNWLVYFKVGIKCQNLFDRIVFVKCFPFNIVMESTQFYLNLTVLFFFYLIFLNGNPINLETCFVHNLDQWC